MPELPEVETTVRSIRDLLIGRHITTAWLDWPNSLVIPSPDIFMARLQGQAVRDVTRRAKYILIHLEADVLIIHLKMSGRLYVVPDAFEDYADKWVHFLFQLDNSHQLRFSDSRKFGRVYLTENAEDVIGGLGPEPLEDAFTKAVFKDRIAGRSGKIKPLLLNQKFVAGIGNIYADEALHFAKIYPTRTADTLSESEIEKLWEGIRAALNAGIEREGASVNWYRKPDGTKGSAQDGLQVYGRAGEPCLTCGEAIVIKTTVAQRGTHFCPNCQREK